MSEGTPHTEHSGRMEYDPDKARYVPKGQTAAEKEQQADTKKM